MSTTLAAIETKARFFLNELSSMSDPSAPTVTPQGASGATAYSYVVVALNRTGQTAASAAGATAIGNATLDSSNFNRVTWTAVTNATAYRIYRSIGGVTVGQIGIVGAVLQFDDTGLAGDTTIAPTVNTSGGRFWSSAELIGIANDGLVDLWGAIVDLHQEHFQTVDVTNVSIAAESLSLTGVPADCFRVLSIEPRDTTSSGSYRDLLFRPRHDNHDDMVNARSQGSLNPTIGGVVYYTLTQAGAPVAAPTVLCAPKLSTAITLRFVYVPTLAVKTASDSNPIGGGSDNAVIAWIVAYARAKEREDRMPDPNWLAIYATEKRNILTRSTPRQEHEAETVDDLFDAYL